MKTNKDYTVRFKVANTDYGNITVPKGTLFCDCELPSSDFELDDGTICCCRCENPIAK